MEVVKFDIRQRQREEQAREAKTNEVKPSPDPEILVQLGGVDEQLVSKAQKEVDKEESPDKKVEKNDQTPPQPQPPQT